MENNGNKRRFETAKTLKIAAAAALAVYLVVAYGFTSQIDSMRVCRGMRVEVVDSLRGGFVKASELEAELGPLFTEAAGRRIADISLDEIERRLEAVDKIESVNATVMTDDSIIVTVTPLIPVMRVYDRDKSYYINRDGKRIVCDARYSSDVPVVRGNFAADDPARYIELVTTIESRPLWRELISLIDVASPDNVYLIPDIRGQVIAVGSPDGIAGKLDRVEEFYRKVMPCKGWNHYDTLSVKWDGQLVASRARKTPVVRNVVVDESDDTDDYHNLGLDELIDSTVLVAKQTPAPSKSPSEKP